MALIDDVIAKVKDDSGRLSATEDYLSAVTAALAKYSKDRPKIISRDLVGNGTNDIALPVEWVDEVSAIASVEYPVGNVPETLLQADDYTIYQQPAGESLRLKYQTPDAGDAIRLRFSVQRAEADIIDGESDAVACLAASYCCQLLSNLTAHTNDPTIMADSVNHGSKSGQFARRAAALKKIYTDRIGVDDSGGATAAMTTAAAPDDRRLRLTHWRTR